MVVIASSTILRDIAVVEIQFSALMAGIAFGNVAPARPQGFHFRAGQNDSGFHGIVYEIGMTRLAVLCDETIAMLILAGHGRMKGCTVVVAN